ESHGCLRPCCSPPCSLATEGSSLSQKPTSMKRNSQVSTCGFETPPTAQMRLLSETQAPRRFAVTVRTMKTNGMAIRTAAGIAALGLALAGWSGAEAEDGSGDGESPPAAAAGRDSGSSDEASEPAADDDPAEEDANSDSSALPADADLSKESPSVSPEDGIET